MRFISVRHRTHVQVELKSRDASFEIANLVTRYGGHVPNAWGGCHGCGSMWP